MGTVMQTLESKVDYRLLASRCDLVLCSPCFQNGTVTPVPQLISDKRPIRNVCRRCARQSVGVVRPLSELPPRS